jgi:hypothetical protein
MPISKRTVVILMAGVLLCKASLQAWSGDKHRSLRGIFTPVLIDPVERRPQKSCKPGKLYSRHDGAGALKPVLWANSTCTLDTSAAAHGLFVKPGEGLSIQLRRSGQYQPRRHRDQSRRVTYPPALIVSKRFGRRRSQEGGRDGGEAQTLPKYHSCGRGRGSFRFSCTLRTVPAFCSLMANTSFTGL